MANPSKAPEFFGPIRIVREFAAASRFYKETIGLEGEGAAPYAEFLSNSCKPVLLDQSFWGSLGGAVHPPSAAGPREGVVLAIRVENVDRELARLRSTGTSVLTPPTDRHPMGRRNFQLLDPDGNVGDVDSTRARSGPDPTG